MFGIVSYFRKQRLIKTLSQTLLNLSSSSVLHFDNIQNQITQIKEDLLGLSLNQKDLQKEAHFWYNSIKALKKENENLKTKFEEGFDELALLKEKKLAIEAEIAALTLERDTKFTEKFIGE